VKIGAIFYANRFRDKNLTAVILIPWQNHFVKSIAQRSHTHTIKYVLSK